eukprot:Phypoly_transcript_19524.p1 GENE.Phypoly_transcript_19524~~Phypoly_transcript_19524.p1  ORF type:complete len:169 (+),score=24.03 Phypoly_transcript_19524:96-602(+)
MHFDKILGANSSSLVVSPEVIESYKAMERNSPYRWTTFKMSDDENQLLVDQHGAPDSTYASLLAALPAQEPRWVLIHFEYRTTRGPSSKLMFVTYVPDSITRSTYKEAARIKSKGVLWATVLKPILKAVSGNVQANDIADMDWQAILQKAARFELDPVDLAWRPPQDM